MVFFNYALRKLNAKIVYYGPGLCGKTTNLQWIHDHFEGGQRGKMISLSTEGDRTIFFDLLPLEIGSIRGMDVTLQLYTVPGQVHYNSTRQLVLRGADGVVFVADSQSTMRSSNVESLHNLEENLTLQGVELDSFPHVLQFNKRDLGDLISVEDLDSDLNQHSVPFFEAVATEGVGVQETLEGIVKLVMRSLRERYEPMAVAGVTGAVRGPVPLDVEVPARRPERTQVPPIEPPRPPLVAPMPAGRPRMRNDGVGFQDDVPTRVYDGDRPGPGGEETSGIGGGFWSMGAGRSAGADQAAPKSSGSDFGFTMPFADTETTTDVSELGEHDGGEVAAQAEDAGWASDEGELDVEPVDLSGPSPTPFEVGDLTPEPFTVSSVFGGEGAFGAVPEAETGEPDPEPVAGAEAQGETDDAGDSWGFSDLQAGPTEEHGGAGGVSQVAADVPAAALTDGWELPAAAPEDEPSGPVETRDGARDAAAEDGAPAEPQPASERPASWPARLRGTVDDLVASVLGSRPKSSDRDAQEPRLEEPAEAEPEPELELSPPDAPVIDDGRELEPEPDLAERAWWETPLDEPAAAEESAAAGEIAAAGAAELDIEPVVEPATPADENDRWSRRLSDFGGGEELERQAGDFEPAPSIEVGLEDDWIVTPIEGADGTAPAVEDSEAFDPSGAGEVPAELGESMWRSDDGGHAGGERGFAEDRAALGGLVGDGFMADEVVEATPPPMGERDWYEAHTGEVLPVEDEPPDVTASGGEALEAEGAAPLGAFDEDAAFAAEVEPEADAEDLAPAPAPADEIELELDDHDSASEAAFASPEPAGSPAVVAPFGAEPEPFDAPADPDPFASEPEPAPEPAMRPRPRRAPITLGEGDPFGEVVDDEPTPIRAEVMPQVSIVAPAIDSLVRKGDNQLHLRLHGSGAIAESGQVRALDIEVPVPGSWVGNQRVTLQLRLTLTPVAEDDDGGPGGSP